MRDHDSDVEFLNSLLERPPTPEDRGRVIAVLGSESESLTRLAAKVLAEWGDRASVEALRDLLTASDSIEPFGWVYRDISVSALRHCVGPEDASWVLGGYFSAASAHDGSVLLPLVLRLPRRLVRERVISEFQLGGSDTAWAVMKIIEHLYAERAPEILQYYTASADSKVASEATRLMELLGAPPYQRTVRALRRLLPRGIPEHLGRKTAKKRITDFDANDIFSVLTHLSMQPGYVLDYVYHFDGAGGFPILYSRPEQSVPKDSLPPGMANSFPSEVTSDGTAEAFFELALLSIMGGQFYLWWHANYNDRRIICHATDIDELLQGTGPIETFPEELATRTRDLELEPGVKMSENSVTVSLVVFTKWGGVFAQECVFSRTTPHDLIDVQPTCLIEYNCGVRF